MAPVCAFQNLIVRSAVPPPEASKLRCMGHQLNALTAACVGGRSRRWRRGGLRGVGWTRRAAVPASAAARPRRSRRRAPRALLAPDQRFAGLAARPPPAPALATAAMKPSGGATASSTAVREAARARRRTRRRTLERNLVLAHDRPRRALARLRLARPRRVPETQVVLVAARGQCGAVGGPAQAADLLLVAD